VIIPGSFFGIRKVRFMNINEYGKVIKLNKLDESGEEKNLFTIESIGNIFY